MGLYEDFVKARGGNRYLQRIAQHIDFVAGAKQKMDANDPRFLLDMPGAALGTVVGLPSDLGTMAGEDIFGQFVGEMAQRTAKGSEENNRIANAYLEGGPGAALEAARTDKNSALAWAAGGGAMLSDPTLALSLLAGGASQAKNAPKVLKLADYALNRPTDEIVGAITPLAKQVIKKAGPLVKKGKPVTERAVVPGALAAREVIDEVGQKPLKLGREKIEQGKILEPAKLSMTPEQARLEARRLLAEQAQRQAAAAKTEALVAQMGAPKSATKSAGGFSPTELGTLGLTPEGAALSYRPTPEAEQAIKSAKAKAPAAIAPELAPIPKRKGKVGQVAFSPPSGDLGSEAVDFNDLAQLMGGPAPEMDLASPLKESQKKGLGIIDPNVQKTLKGIGKQMAVAPVRSGAGVGALLGAAGAQDTDGDGNIGKDERLRAAVEGAAVGGLAGGATKIPFGTVKDVAKIGNRAGKEGFGRAVNEGKFLNGPALAGDWSADKVVTGRNAFMDEISGRFRGLLAGLKQSDINGTTKSLVERTKATGVPAEFDQELEDILKLTGQDPTEFNARAQFGQGFVSDVLGDAKKGPVLHPLASAGAGAAYGLLDASNLAVPGLGVAVGAARGLARPYTSEFFHATNDLTHMGIRNAAYKVELRRLLNDVGGEMIDRLKAAGLDTSGLDARGLFSPDQIKALGGPEANRQAAVWADVLRQVYGHGDTRGLAGKFVVDTFGNYSTRSALQKAMNALSPFSRYQLGQIPVVAKMAAKNPAAALMIANVLQKSGGKITVGTDTPLVGGLVQEELGGPGVEGEGTISPISALLPVPTDINKGAQALEYADNPYEQALALMEGAGFGVNPLVRTAGYLVGADDLGPGTQSRFAGVEQAMPGPEIPTIAGVLREARKAIAPIDKYGSDYDVVQARLNEVVLRETKKPLADPANHALAVQLAQNPEHPFWKQAEEEALHGQAAKSALSGINPVTISAKTEVDKQGDKARAGIPYTPDQIKQAAGVSERAARMMQAENDRYKKANPAAATGDRPKLSTKETQDPRLTEWERRNKALKSANPRVWAEARADFMKLAGIK